MPGDAEAIYALKVAAFGDSSLPFTIYRSQKSLAHLRSLILTTYEPEAQHRIKVIVQGTSLLGYYHATPVERSFFLNYIAVAGEARSAGLGSQLLSDFELTAVALGFRHAGLDVLARNQGVCEWYFRHGYQLQEKRHHVRIALDAMPGSLERIEWDNQDWADALEDEQRQGFARLTARLGVSQIGVGLIDSCAVKLLSWPDDKLEPTLAAIANTFARRRSELIISGLSAPPTHLPYIAVEPALRLGRELQGEPVDEIAH